MRDEMFDLTLGSVGVYHRGMSRGIGVLMVLKGTVTVELNGFRRVLEADDIVIVNDRDIHSVQASSSNIVLALRIFPSFLERECPEILDYSYDCSLVSHGENSFEKSKFFYAEPLGTKSSSAKFFNAKRSLIRMMLARYRREDGYALEVKCVLLELLHNIYVNFRATPARGAKETHEDIGNIRNALSHIRENYRTGVDLADAAASVGMSPQYFSRLFKQKMGVGFLEYLNRLRLDSAVHELLRTNESILRIAVNNGFAGSKPFTVLFKKIYGQTPQSYRLSKPNSHTSKTPHGEKIERTIQWEVEENEKNNEKNEENSERFGNGRPFAGVEEHPGGHEGFNDLLKYVTLYDIHDSSRLKPSESISVSLLPTSGAKEEENKRKTALSLPPKIFKIGKLSEVMDERIREQLITVRKKMGGDYIYFQGIFGDGISPHQGGSYFKGYDYGRLFHFFMELGLTPFVRVDLSLAPEAIEGAVSDFMNALSENALLSQWGKKIRFEIVHSNAINSEVTELYPSDGAVPRFIARFDRICHELKAFSPLIRVGFHSVSSSRSEEWARLSEKLAGCKKAGCPPDFLSLTIDPALEEDYTALGASPRSIKAYGISQIEKVRRVSTECGISLPELFVTEWNTLSGRTPIESSTFFRAALIAAELLSYGESVSGTAYWLNSKSKELLTGKVDNRVLALFFEGRVKRPPYYLLYMIAKLEKNVVWRSEKVLVTSTGTDERAAYAVLISNPCYFDPRYSVNEAYVVMESIRVEVKLTDIPKGRYRVKVFFFEKKHSVVFDRWSKLGFPNLSDEDAADYLESAALPELNIFEDDIDAEYTLAPELGYNGVALYLFRRIVKVMDPNSVQSVQSVQ
ncbi:MAG: helix-turn-helix domain-containing protein [Synergistaceae bacterium]|jgi:beta-xylosidase/AraC-like DNA-binding protein|nr:helix-turn-helix domain-containing protein [Synergistaceae bacterium]